MWGACGKNEQVGKAWAGVECSLPAPSLSFSLKFRISAYYFSQEQTLLHEKENGGALAWPLMIPKAHNDLVLQPLPGKSREGPTDPTQESNNNWWIFPQDSALNNQKTFKLTILTLSMLPRHLNQATDQSTKLKIGVLSLISTRGFVVAPCHTPTFSQEWPQSPAGGGDLGPPPPLTAGLWEGLRASRRFPHLPFILAKRVRSLSTNSSVHRLGYKCCLTKSKDFGIRLFSVILTRVGAPGKQQSLQSLSWISLSADTVDYVAIYSNSLGSILK